MINNLLRQIPKVDEILAHPLLSQLEPSASLTQAVRCVLDKLRGNIRNGNLYTPPCRDIIAAEILQRYNNSQRPNLKRVVNGTGIILHTNLGRAPLSEEALTAINETARGYSNLEYNESKGKRSSRNAHVEELLKLLTGAEAAMSVNNNAAAVMLALSAVAKGKDVIVSRGELVEIGGGFRVPDVLLESGCRLVEVGTTNKTHLKDYENAIIPGQTGAVLRVHTSNFVMTGFVARPELSELAGVAKKHSIPLVEDMGSGCLIPLVEYGIRNEPVVADSIKAGAGIVTFSGDKLLGGPQAGLIAGQQEYLEKMKSHPLARALRIDKLCIAALEATLRLYLNPAKAVRTIPILQMLCQYPDNLFEKACRLKQMLPCESEVITESSQAGGGAMPEEGLVSSAVAFPQFPAQALERHFREAQVPIIGRISRDRFMLDVRTLWEDDFPAIAQRLGEFEI